MLSVWIDDMGQRHMPVSHMTIQNKALNLFNFLKNQQEDEMDESWWFLVDGLKNLKTCLTFTASAQQALTYKQQRNFLNK
jgi:hypothetical protein